MEIKQAELTLSIKYLQARLELGNLATNTITAYLKKKKKKESFTAHDPKTVKPQQERKVYFFFENPEVSESGFLDNLHTIDIFLTQSQNHAFV